MRHKTKKQRQDWWNGLTEDQQGLQLSVWQKDKKDRRDKKSLQTMKRLNLNYDCKICIHGLTESCTDRPKNGCLYFADEVNEIYGPKVA